MIRLDIPYRSQWAADAGRYVADCGPTCLTMTLNYWQIPLTPDRAYDFIKFYNEAPAEKIRERRGVTNIGELRGVARQHQIPTEYIRYANAASGLDGLRSCLQAGQPYIALVKYAPWRQITRQTYSGGHFVVVTGYDNDHILMHDPLLNPTTGAHFKMPMALFCEGWGGFVPADENPNWTGFTVGEATAVAEATTVAASAPSTAAPAPPAAAPARIMEDEERRIRALAGYRQADPPDFNDAQDAQLWRDRLGDWGLTYDYHVIQSGDTLSTLSGRFYGSQSHWRALHAYNNLSRAGIIYAGQTLLIPQLGQSGAHLDESLPRNTIGRSKAGDFSNLSNPDADARDYDALVSAVSVGMGQAEEE